MPEAPTTAPERLAMFPLSTVLFPSSVLPLHVFEPRYRALVADCLAGSGEFGVVLIARGSEVGGGDERLRVGTVARIDRASPLSDGRWSLVTSGTRRVRVTEWLPDDPYPVALVADAHPQPDASPTDDELLAAAVSAVRRSRALLSEAGRGAALPSDLQLDPDPEVAAWQVCGLAPISPFDKQRLLETDERGARLAEVAALSSAVGDDVNLLLSRGL
ncbi:MAG: LON peptidase substrate-binding domain-containing protein [Acidimicrobiales bacterium]